MPEQITIGGVDFEASGATTASGAFVVDNNYFVLAQALQKLTNEVMRNG